MKYFKKQYLIFIKRKFFLTFIVIFSVITIFYYFNCSAISKSPKFSTLTTTTAIFSKIIITPQKQPNTRNLIEKNDYIEITKQNTVNDLLIVSISNYGFKNLTLNWITNLYKLGFNKFVVFCFDQELYEFLSEKGYKNNLAIVPSNWLDFKVSKSFLNWGSKDYNQITQAKPQIWYQLLKLKLNIFFSDPDVVWLNEHIIDHLKFIYEYSTADLLFSLDNNRKSVTYNTGLFTAKCTPYSIDLFLNLINEQRKNPSYSNQKVFKIITKKMKSSDNKIIALDPILFASGKVFLKLKLNKKYNLNPYTFHANYLIGMQAKINALKANNYWFI
jgi:hypothetical protein